MHQADRLRRLIERDDIVYLPGVHDALTVRLAAERDAVEAVQHSGYGTAAALLGLPDLDFTSLTEAVGTIRRMARVAGDTPVVVDGDTGFGGVVNLTRTVPAFEQAGASGMFIEDQETPKRCGLMAGKEVVDTERMVGTLQAACAARTDDAFVVIARTDAYAEGGVDAVVERGRRYDEAGAEALLIGEVVPLADLEAICGSVPLPVYALMARMEHDEFPAAHPVDAYEDAGASMVCDVTALLQTAVHHMDAYLDEMLETGDNRDVEMVPLSRLSDRLGQAEYQAFADAYDRR